MITPTISPTTTEQPIMCQFSSPSAHRIRNVATTIRAELRFVPTPIALMSCFMLASSRVRTQNIPIIDRIIPTAAISMGAITALNCISTSPPCMNAAAPSEAVASIEPQYDSYRSAPIPATSPTLSPTLSAIVAGLRGSSSGMFSSTFPTRSAPTSAALV